MEIRMMVHDEILGLGALRGKGSVIDRYMKYFISGKLDKGVQYLSEQFDDSFMIIDEYRCDSDENGLYKNQYKLAVIREGGEPGFLLNVLVRDKKTSLDSKANEI